VAQLRLYLTHRVLQSSSYCWPLSLCSDEIWLPKSGTPSCLLWRNFYKNLSLVQFYVTPKSVTEHNFTAQSKYWLHLRSWLVRHFVFSECMILKLHDTKSNFKPSKMTSISKYIFSTLTLTIHIYILIIIIIIIIMFINCSWVVTLWQWLFYMYTNMKKK